MCVLFFITFFILFSPPIRKFGHEAADDIKIQKHKVIAQTWAKRKEFQDKGRLSISFYESHTDPVGLNFDVNDLNSGGTNEMSSTWVNYLPNITRRRFALTGVAATNSSSCGPRKSSVDSEISVSVRQFSMESRRNSMDSQVSVKIAEVQTKVARRSRGGSGVGGGGGSSSTHHHHIKGKSRSRSRFNRRESSTSVESQIITSSNYHHPAGGHKMGIFSRRDKRTKSRRSATAGLTDADNINSLITNFPEFSRNFQGMTTTSDDDNHSRASVKIQDSRVDVVMRHQGDDEQFIAGAMQHKKHIQTSTGFGTTTTSSMRQGTAKFYPNIQTVLHHGGAGGGSGAVNNGSSFNSMAAAAAAAAAATTTTAAVMDSALRSSREGSRTSRNSQRSGRGSRKSTSKHHSLKRNRKSNVGGKSTTMSSTKQPQRMVEKGYNSGGGVGLELVGAVSLDDSSFTSYTSDLVYPNGMTATGQSSFSGHSVGKHSRSSKQSCDVGTQANAYEIATQTMSFEENNENLMKAIVKGRTANNVNDNEDDDDDDDDVYQESHKLLMSHPLQVPAAPITTTSISSHQRQMSESEKLKMLLLPSK